MRSFLPLSLRDRSSAIILRQSFVGNRSSSRSLLRILDSTGMMSTGMIILGMRFFKRCMKLFLRWPPGAAANTWTGKRATLQAAGFGFLVLFTGRTFSELKTPANAIVLGNSDSRQTEALGHREFLYLRPEC